MKEISIKIDKAGKEFMKATQTGARTNRYSKDKNHQKKVEIAQRIEKKYEIKDGFFVELVASKNF